MMNVCVPKRVKTYIFGENLLQCLAEQVPFKHLEVLLDVTRLGVRELHDALEEVTVARLVFGDGGGPKTLQVAPDAILLLDREFAIGESFEEIDDVNRGDKARVRFLTIDAGDDAVVLSVLVLHDRVAGDDETPAVLDLGEADETATSREL